MTYRSGYRISELCVELDCSERYLNQVFKRDIGLPPKVWMRGERMVVAKQMLVEGRLAHEVGESLGFATMDSFRREFLGFFRVRPLDFRVRVMGGVLGSGGGSS